MSYVFGTKVFHCLISSYLPMLDLDLKCYNKNKTMHKRISVRE